MRRATECWDVEVVREWALAAKETYGMRIALLGLIVAAHFNSLRTWGVVSQAFGHHVNLPAVTLLMRKCGTLWGKAGSLALYGSANMSGSGHLPHGDIRAAFQLLVQEYPRQR